MAKSRPAARSWRVARPCAGAISGPMTQAVASKAFPAPGHDHDLCLEEAMERARQAFQNKGLKLTPLRAVGVPRDRRLAQGDRRLRGARPAGRPRRAAGADLGLPGHRGAGGGRHRAPLREPQRLLCLPCRPRDAPAGAGLRDVRARGGGRRRQGVRRHRQVARARRGSRPRVRWSRCGACAPLARARGGSRRMEAPSAQDELPPREPAARDQVARPRRHDSRSPSRHDGRRRPAARARCRRADQRALAVAHALAGAPSCRASTSTSPRARS